MSDPPVDLSLLAHQQRQIITDLAAIRDDMAVLTAIAMRQDGTSTTLLTEIRAMHSQQAGWPTGSATLKRPERRDHEHAA